MKSCEGFLWAALAVPGHPGPVCKIAKMALSDPCMEFEFFLGQITSFDLLLKCHSLTLSKKVLGSVCPSKFLSERINWIIWRIPHSILKILFVNGSYEVLAMLKGEVREAPFFKGQSCKVTVWCALYWVYCQIFVNHFYLMF